VVQHEIDARARSQGGELFEEFQGLEEEVARAIVSGALELQQDATVPGEPRTILGDRGAQQVAAELLEPRTIFCWYEQVRVEIEALKMGLTGPGRGDPGGHRGRARGEGRERRPVARETRAPVRRRC